MDKIGLILSQHCSKGFKYVQLSSILKANKISTEVTRGKAVNGCHINLFIFLVKAES